MKPASLAVIKVGGSLLDWPQLPERLTAFLGAGHEASRADRTVLIVGGGRAVDVIRTLDVIHRLGERTAHELALHALDLTAAILAALVPGSIVVDRMVSLFEAWEGTLFPILAPRRVLDEIERSSIDPLPASWEVTSDTIAARIAVHLEAQCLVLLKSAALPPSMTLDDAARHGLVDLMLPLAARSLPRVEYVNLRDPSVQPCQLFPVPGGRVDRTPEARVAEERATKPRVS